MPLLMLRGPILGPPHRVYVCVCVWQAPMSQHRLEDVLQFSQSQQQSFFSFSFMQDGRFMVTYRFQTPEVGVCT
jgi:hypothetical protein